MKKTVALLLCVAVLLLSSSCLLTMLAAGGSVSRVTTIKDTITPSGHLVQQVMRFSFERVINKSAHYSYYSNGYSYQGYESNLFYAYVGKELLNGEIEKWFLQFDCFSPVFYDDGRIPLLLRDIMLSIDGIVYPFHSSSIKYSKEVAYQDMYKSSTYGRSWDTWHGQVVFALDEDIVDMLSTASEVKIMYFSDPSVPGKEDGSLITVSDSVLTKLQTYLKEAQSEATTESLYVI